METVYNTSRDCKKGETFVTTWKLGRVNFCKDFWDLLLETGPSWPARPQSRSQKTLRDEFRLQFPSVANWNPTFDESDNFSVSHKVDSGKISVQTFLFRLQTQPTSSQLCVNGTWTIAAINIHLGIWLEVKTRSQRNFFSFSVARVYLCIFYHPQYIQFCIHICNCPVCWHIFLQSSNTVSCSYQHIRRYLFKDVKSR